MGVDSQYATCCGCDGPFPVAQSAFLTIDAEPSLGEKREKTVGVSDFTLLGRRFCL